MMAANKDIINLCSILLICSAPIVSGILELDDIDAYNEQICGKTPLKFRSVWGLSRANESTLRDDGRFDEDVPTSNRMSNGWIAEKGEIPWFALMKITFPGERVNNMCGGVLIDNNLVLTAAHCVHNYDTSMKANEIEVSLGQNNREKPGEKRLGVKACVPLRWRELTEERRDIALVVLDRSVSYNKYIQPACLNSGRIINDADCLTAGFGRISDMPVRHSAQMLVLPMKKCQKKAGIYDICFTASKKKYIGTSCKGDSGGGIFCKADGRRYAVGLVSRGPPNDCIKGKRSTTFFSNIYAQKRFLKNIFDECVNNRSQSE